MISILKTLSHLSSSQPPLLFKNLNPSTIFIKQNGSIAFFAPSILPLTSKFEDELVPENSEYIAPEQLLNEATSKSMQYSLGTTLVHLVTGVSPTDLPVKNMKIQFKEQAGNIDKPLFYVINKLIDPREDNRFLNFNRVISKLGQSYNINQISASIENKRKATGNTSLDRLIDEIKKQREREFKEIIFSNNSVDEIVRDKINKRNKDETIVAKDLEVIKEINLSDKDITDISNLEYFINLEKLWLSNNNIKDLSPLRKLKKLIYLDLINNPVYDYSPVKHIPIVNKTEKKVSNNYNSSNNSSNNSKWNTNNRQTQNNNSQSTNTNSTPKWGSPNQVNKTVRVNENQKVIFEDKEIESEIRKNLNKSFIDNITIKDLKKIKELNLSNKGIKSIKDLKNLINLEKLWLASNQIRDLSPLKDLKKIKYIDIANNPIFDYSYIKYIPIINNILENSQNTQDTQNSNKKVNNSWPPINNSQNNKKVHAPWPPVSNNQNNKKVNNPWPPVSNNQNNIQSNDNKNDKSKKVNFLNKEIENEVRKQLSKSFIDVISFYDLEKVKELNLNNKKINNISDLKNMINLEKLWLMDNQIKDLEPVSKLKKLKFLDIRNNPIFNYLPVKFVSFLVK